MKVRAAQIIHKLASCVFGGISSLLLLIADEKNGVLIGRW